MHAPQKDFPVFPNPAGGRVAAAVSPRPNRARTVPEPCPALPSPAAAAQVAATL